MATYGRQLLSGTGRPIHVVAGDGRDIHWKVGGITLDWGLFAAVSVDTTLSDESVVLNGQKYARYGQILCRVRNTEIQTVTLANTTGGTFTLAGSDAIDFDATAEEMQTALEEIFGVGNVAVSGPATGVYTVTFHDSLGNVTTMVAVDSTTGSGHSVTVATVNQGAGNEGKWGPYDPAATDGRQLLTRGDCHILDSTVLQNGVIPPLGGGVTDHPAVFDGGGPVWKARLMMTTGTHSLAAGPTVTEFEAAFPGIWYAQN